MMKVFGFISLCLILVSLASCRSNCNKWTENDCNYIDYYQSPPLTVPDKNYYHSDPIQPE